MAPLALSADSQASESIPIPSYLTYTSTRLPQPSQRALLSHLHTTNSIPDLSEHLTDSLSRTGWTDRVRALALELLRSGRCVTFPELLEEVLERAKVPKVEDPTINGVVASGANKTTNSAASVSSSRSESQSQSNGVNGSQSDGAIQVRPGWFGPDGLPDVRIPSATVEDGVQFLKERIAEVVEIVEGDEDDD